MIIPMDIGQKAELHKILCVLYRLSLFSTCYEGFGVQIVFSI